MTPLTPACRRHAAGEHRCASACSAKPVGAVLETGPSRASGDVPQVQGFAGKVTEFTGGH